MMSLIVFYCVFCYLVGTGVLIQLHEEEKTLDVDDMYDNIEYKWVIIGFIIFPILLPIILGYILSEEL